MIIYSVLGNTLNDYESKLHLVAQYEQREGLFSQLKETLPKEVLAESKVQQVLAQMEDIMAFDSLSENCKKPFNP